MCPRCFGNGFDLGFVMGQDPCEYLIRVARADQGSVTSTDKTRQTAPLSSLRNLTNYWDSQ